MIFTYAPSYVYIFLHIQRRLSGSALVCVRYLVMIFLYTGNPTPHDTPITMNFVWFQYEWIHVDPIVASYKAK